MPSQALLGGAGGAGRDLPVRAVAGHAGRPRRGHRAPRARRAAGRPAAAALERLAHVDTVIFDKTGTLTRGQPRIERTERSATAPQRSRSAWRLRRPWRRTRRTRWRGHSAAPPPAPRPAEVVSAPGRGIEGQVTGVRYRIGRAEYVTGGTGRARSPPSQWLRKMRQSIILLARPQAGAGGVPVADTLRADAAQTVAAPAGPGTHGADRQRRPRSGRPQMRPPAAGGARREGK